MEIKVRTFKIEDTEVVVTRLEDGSFRMDARGPIPMVVHGQAEDIIEATEKLCGGTTKIDAHGGHVHHEHVHGAHVHAGHGNHSH